MEGPIVEMDMFHLRWLRWWMNFSENRCQAKFWLNIFYVVVVVILHAQICFVVSPNNDKLLHWSAVASQGLQNNCMLVITPATKWFNIFETSYDQRCHKQGCLLCQWICLRILISFITPKHPQKECNTALGPETMSYAGVTNPFLADPVPCKQGCIQD